MSSIGPKLFKGDLYRVDLEERGRFSVCDNVKDVFSHLFSLVQSISRLAYSILTCPFSSPKLHQWQADDLTDQNWESYPSPNRTSSRNHEHDRKLKETLVKSGFQGKEHETIELPKTARIPGGVRNSGNTCFLAAALQVVFHSPYIAKRILLAERLSKETEGPKTVYDELAKAYRTTAVEGKNYTNTRNLRSLLQNSTEGNALDQRASSQDDSFAMLQVLFNLLQIPPLPLAKINTFSHENPAVDLPITREVYHKKVEQFLRIDADHEEKEVDMTRSISYFSEQETTSTPAPGSGICPWLPEGTQVRQDILLDGDNLPIVIPVRKTTDQFFDGTVLKKEFEVHNTKELLIPIYNSNLKAKYRRIAIAMHTGNSKLGHWRAYADDPHVLFNDASVKEVKDPETDIQKNGTLFLYEFVETIES